MHSSKDKLKMSNNNYELDFNSNHDSPEFEKIDLNRAPAEVVGTAALQIQDKSKAAMHRIVNKMGLMEDLAKEELIELQK